LLLLSFVAFVSLGLPDGLLGVAWPSIRATFALRLDALGPLLISTTAGYVTSSFLSGPLLMRMNLGVLLGLSAGATATSLIAYALAPVWPVMVAFGTLAGLGAGAIDAGLNTFVARHYSARTLNMLHAFYGLGTTAGPMIMTTVLLAQRPWQRGYALVGVAQIGLAICFVATRGLWPAADPVSPQATAAAAPVSATLRLPAAWLGIAAFAGYVGVEAAAGAWIYTYLSEGCGFSMSAAGTGVSLFWGGLMSGRVVFGLLPGTRRPARLLRLSLCGVAAAAAALWIDVNAAATTAAVAVLGFACGPIFPSLIATTPDRVGAAHTANTVGFQVAAAALGQSMLPAGVGVLAQRAGIEIVPQVILLSSLVVSIACELMAWMPPIGRAVAAREGASRQAGALRTGNRHSREEGGTPGSCPTAPPGYPPSRV
jgi:fucose permease